MLPKGYTTKERMFVVFPLCRFVQSKNRGKKSEIASEGLQMTFSGIYVELKKPTQHNPLTK